ncbi:MAG: hypothetical protein IKX70_00085 [Treponema sp.]|nr:hypothetical protein [Treponema sp.]
MKKSITIIYSVLASLVLIFAIAFFAVNIYNENAHGELRTEVRFEKVASGVKAALGKSNITASEKTRQIENTIGDTKDFAYIKIMADNKVIYLFPQDFESESNINSRFIIAKDRNFNANGSRVNISCGLYSLRPGTIFEYAKISFFIILIITLLTIILIIYNNHFDKSSAKKTYKSKNPKKEFIYKITEEDEGFDEDDEPEEADDSEEEYVSTSDEIIEEEPVEAAEPVEELPVETKKEELPVQDFEPVEIQKEAKPVSENCLFSADTGLGWESYLMTRLDNELNRATASELDLALFVIKIDGIGRKNPVMKKICEYLTVEFQFKDLLFEYKDDSICGIKISMDIDNAVSFAEKLVAEIKNIAGEENPTVLTGVTTRGIRMVSGERLLKEADEAVKHAAEDTANPVVGFRADAVKYRKFLEKN